MCFLCSGPLGRAGLLRETSERKGSTAVGREKGAQDGNGEGNRVLGGINHPHVGLHSYCNRAKLLIKLCILTVITEHFCVFE